MFFLSLDITFSLIPSLSLTQPFFTKLSTVIYIVPNLSRKLSSSLYATPAMILFKYQTTASQNAVHYNEPCGDVVAKTLQHSVNEFKLKICNTLFKPVTNFYHKFKKNRFCIATKNKL